MDNLYLITGIIANILSIGISLWAIREVRWKVRDAAREAETKFQALVRKI